MTSTDAHVRIFDTTLRDGEQAPGATMSAAQKLEVARTLSRLGVDVIEAGFPAASADDLNAVRGIAALVGQKAAEGRSEPPIICALARASVDDLEARLGRRARRGAAAAAHVLGDERAAHEAQAAHDARPGGRARAHHGGSCAHAVRRRRVQPRGRRPQRARVLVARARSGHRRRRHDGEHSRHRRLHDAGRVRRADRRHSPARPQHRAGDHQRALPRRSRAGDGEHAGRAARRRPPGGGHDQRHRRARGQLRARRGRDGAAHALLALSYAHRHRHHAAHARVQAGGGGDGLRGAAEQGHRRRQRVRARVGHPPGRHAQARRDLRDHAAGDGRRRTDAAGARQALGASMRSRGG